MLGVNKWIWSVIFLARYTSNSTLYTLHHFTLYTPHLTPHTLHSTLYTLHSTLHIFYSALYTLYSTVYTPFLFSHNYDSGGRDPTCGHSVSWASSCFAPVILPPFGKTSWHTHCKGCRGYWIHHYPNTDRYLETWILAVWGLFWCNYTYSLDFLELL